VPGDFSLVPFHGLSPIIKSLHLEFRTLPSSRVLDLVLSFSLLRDLTVITSSYVFADNDNGSDGLSTIAQPSGSPVLTRTLKLFLRGGMEPITRRLLSLPGGIHFRKLAVAWNHREDPSSTTALVKGCSHTLESLRITCNLLDKSSIDISKAGKLKDVGFLGSRSSVQWVTRSLQTITPNHRNLQQIALDTPSILHVNHPDPVHIRRIVGETTYRDWLELDHLLAKLCESHSIHLKVLHLPEYVGGVGSCVETLLPEVTRRGMVGLAELG